MNKREFITLLGGAAATWPLAARAQQTARSLRVGFVGVQPRDAPIYVAFRKRMAELGYREGKYFTFEYIQTPSIDAYDASFRELLSRKPDIVIAAGNEPALRAARAAAGTLPIVFLAIDFDPVARGYVAVWPDLAATSLESSCTRSNWRQNASNWCAESFPRKRASSGFSGTPRPAIRLRPRQRQPNRSTLNRDLLR